VVGSAELPRRANKQDNQGESEQIDSCKGEVEKGVDGVKRGKVHRCRTRGSKDMPKPSAQRQLVRKKGPQSRGTVNRERVGRYSSFRVFQGDRTIAPTGLYISPPTPPEGSRPRTFVFSFFFAFHAEGSSEVFCSMLSVSRRVNVVNVFRNWEKTGNKAKVHCLRRSVLGSL
jgi:hypothetical protein